MVAIRGRFDGKVFIPDGTVDLPADQRVIMHVQVVGPEPLPKGTTFDQLRKFVGTISTEDLKLMRQAIEQDCERVDEDEW